MDFSGHLMFSSAALCRTAGAGGGKMLLFGGTGRRSFLEGSPVMAGVEDGKRKRPFLTTPDDELQLDDELYGYGQEPERKRRLTAEQVRALERSFEEEKRRLEPERKSELAGRLGIAPRQVAVWFQNRRARWKCKQLEHDFDTLRAAHHELLAGRDALLADNDRLRSQVISLTERLQAKESPPPPALSEREHQTAASATLHGGVDTAATRAVDLKGGGYFCIETGGGGGAGAVLHYTAVGFNDNPDQSYFAETRSPPSSSDEDCGEGGCALFFPDDDVAAVERKSVGWEEEEEMELNYWSWVWN